MNNEREVGRGRLSAYLLLLPGRGGRAGFTSGDGIRIGGLWQLGELLLVCVGATVVCRGRWGRRVGPAGEAIGMEERLSVLRG